MRRGRAGFPVLPFDYLGLIGLRQNGMACPDLTFSSGQDFGGV